MIWFLGCSKEWRTLNNSKAFFGKTLSEKKRGWEVERVCLWCGRRRLKLKEIFLPQPELFSHYLSAVGDKWTVPVTRFLTKRPVISAKLPVHVMSDDTPGMMIFWKPGFKSGFGSWFSQSSKPNVMSDDTSGQTDRLVIPDCSSFLREATALLNKK